MVPCCKTVSNRLEQVQPHADPRLPRSWCLADPPRGGCACAVKPFGCSHRARDRSKVAAAARCRRHGGLRPDFTTAAWRKLLVNALAGFMVLSDGGRQCSAATTSALSRRYVAECLAWRARLRVPDSDDDVVDAKWSGSCPVGPQAGHGHSMLADRAAHRPLEWDLRNGVIVRKGPRLRPGHPDQRRVGAAAGGCQRRNPDSNVATSDCVPRERVGLSHETAPYLFRTVDLAITPEQILRVADQPRNRITA